MSERWKMNRIGFVNFWLYDEEDFEFEDGKLLLRGQNGSGKSITTQSFIPFVLDGDRTPSRLDPFGSSDRRMEYYFLGEEGKEESTGYLFLEFKKAGQEEYRTIGIGQRAKRGKPMDFWGFVILDGRRIGYDLWLYKEVGSNKIPRDKREMKAELGEENFFTDSQSEYKKHVNQYIFGFRKAEQYEQFIRLLVKVRAPKLSKEFKPTRVYDILNDSLQTLTDEDLRPMVDAMEKMDEIQESLETLNRAFGDVKIIRNEYTRYNQYMLAKKAKAYLSKKQEVESAQSEMELQEEKRKEAEKNLSEVKRQTADSLEQKQLKETECGGLLDADLEDADHKLEQWKAEKSEMLAGERRWEENIEEQNGQLFREEQNLQKLKGDLEWRQESLREKKQELDDEQDILAWDQHEKAKQLIRLEEYEEKDSVAESLNVWKAKLEEGQKAIQQYGNISGQYDEAVQILEQANRQKAEGEQRLETAQQQVTDSIEAWITDLYAREKEAAEWRPEKQILREAEEKIQAYASAADGDAARKLLREDYERQRQVLADEKSAKGAQLEVWNGHLREVEEELRYVENQKELEPERDEAAKKTRIALKEKGITALPFYKTVEFAENLDEAACARLEAQLEKAGILDALVVSTQDFAKIEAGYPQFLDTLLDIRDQGGNLFPKLTVNEELSPELKKSVSAILSHIYEKEEQGQGIYLAQNGSFQHGILLGRADKDTEAEYVGYLARKKKKEKKIRELQSQISGIRAEITQLEQDMAQLEARMGQLEKEYQELPECTELQNAILEEERCRLALAVLEQEYLSKKSQEQKLAAQKNEAYQNILKCCKNLPYSRTEEAYEEAEDAAEAYREIWQEVRQDLMLLKNIRSNIRDKEERLEEGKGRLDNAFVEKRAYSIKIKKCEVQIRQLEEYLSRPDLVEKANRLKQLRSELSALSNELRELEKKAAKLEERLQMLKEEEPERGQQLQDLIEEETELRSYFEEELDLKLILSQEERSLPECAKEACKMLRESDKNREATDMLQALHQVYNRHSGSLANYGTSMEQCFGDAENGKGLRKRFCIFSVWNGKRVYLEEFYGILKAAIEETELLIQKKDRELFEDILSQTISQQLTDRIAESKQWVSDMSKLMREMDTSMGLSFSLEWKPCKAENDRELDTVELEQILLRDRALLTMEDIEKVAGHFRSKIRTEKQKLEESETVINYMDLVRDALDYRKWFAFQMFFKRGEEARKPLTNAAFNRFSGGEKAMAMYVPLFGAVNAQYKKAQNKEHPRMIALDEAFAGVDDRNIRSMFELVHKLDFDYIMNSQALWGCFETVKGLRIAELLRPQNSQIVSVIRYTWNGRERILDEQ